ncbi:bifunctional folylpolyglutamate synthase/dihydrofolate synthase [Sulfurihydrogenibium subterraneum]|uniref:bifunctional folylpolyglutamate synthase/dihydrofolate synthase n=1 Tax=Sulfurihydrogenibium subterraneum TaxID=171121 RepID=UPI000490A8FF|nr:folylpolyglutamate synthase/dihydrofolate synthase family protein [Sulfurihydrogenibium subterraneum]
MNLFDFFKKKVFNIEPGLDRITEALQELSNPHKNFKSVLVAGTNGKGSTCAYLESLFRHHGLKVGLFTSPHLIQENERWQINRQNIPKDKLDLYIKDLLPIIQKHSLTYFEASTLLAFKYFSDEKVDVAVVEVGLGGRWDSTNVLDPCVSVITNVSFDHMHLLGDTLDKIAFEKIGITRPDKPAVIGRNQKEIIDWLEKRQVKEFYVQTVDFKPILKENFLWDFEFKDFYLKDIKLSMIGKRQIENASTALASFLVFCEKNSITPVKENIKQALKNTFWQGRMQILSENPLIIADGGHNEEGLLKSFQELKELFKDKKIITVYSFMKDKETEKMFKIIKENSYKTVATKINVSRGMEKEDFYHIGEKNFIENPMEAVEFAKKYSDENSLIFITGSLYLVGEVLDGWNSSDR